MAESEIPDGFKKTKHKNKQEDTLEKINVSKTSTGQKAPKHFFCQKCMDRGVETGYTKCNDLSIHLQSCGLAKEKKHKLQGLFIPFPCVGSGDPPRVLHLYTTNTLDTL